MASVGQARRSRLLLAGLVIAHLIVISGQVETHSGRTLLAQALFGALAPFQRAAGAVVDSLQGAWAGYLDLRGAHEESVRLREQVARLEMLLLEKQQQALEAERLRGLLGLREATRLPAVSAEVVARQGLPWFRSIVVNQGRRAGVRLDAAVLAPAGVVGRVVALAEDAARVQILLDRDCSLGVLVERSRVSAIVQGQVGLADSGTAELRMKYVPALADIQEGDRVLTSGLDGIYPKGQLVGHVRSVGPPAGLFRDVVVIPSVAFDRVEEVLIVQLPPAAQTFPETLQ
jgi:rod shape-determining protein MreC